MAKHNNNGFTFFVLINPKRSSYSFDSYVTPEGEIKGIKVGTDKQTDTPIYKRYVFSRGNRQLRIPNRDKDVIEFLRNNPECQDSPYNEGEIAVYKEVNDDRDAEIALEAITNQKDAINEAFALKGEKLREVAVMCGNDSDKAKVQLNAVVSFASSNPTDFLKMVRDPELTGVKALIRQAEKVGVIKKHGFVYKFDQIALGNSMDAVETRLKEDNELKNAITERLKTS